MQMKILTNDTNKSDQNPLKKRCTMKKTMVVITSLAAAAILVGCAKDNTANVQPTVGHPVITGVLYDPDGKVSRNATVRIRKKSVLALPLESGLEKRGADSLAAKTDNAGRYSFDAVLEPDTYVVEAKSENNAVFIDSVTIVKKDTDLTLASATLEPMGAIKGSVALSQGGNVQQVYVLAFGIDRFAKVNADGSFLFTELAGGLYTLRVISGIPDFSTLDTGNIAVHAAETTDVKTLKLSYRSVLTPQNLNAVFDTMGQVVKLMWNRLDSSLVKGYKIYRLNKTQNSAIPFLDSTLVNDTIFVDSQGIQDQRYEYRIAAINKNNQEGQKSDGVQIKIESYLTLDTVFSPIVLPENADLSMHIEDMTISPTNEIFVPYLSSGLIQVYDSTMQPKRQIGTGNFQLGGITFADNKVFIHQWNMPIWETMTDPTKRTGNGSYSVLVFNSVGLCIDTFINTAGRRIIDIDAHDGLMAIAFQADSTGEGNSISLYSLDGVLKRTWDFDKNFYCTRVLIAESNKIIVALSSENEQLTSNVVIFDSLGNTKSELQTPCGYGASGISFDSKRQRLYVSSDYRQFYFDSTNPFRSPMAEGIIYVYDNDNVLKACYKVINGDGVRAIALDSNGSLFIESGPSTGGNPLPQRVIKLKPVQR
jgi:hypothetical protein